MTEMVCVSPEGRITPGCTGLWTDEQRDAWARVIEFVHQRSHRQDRPAARPLGPQGLDPADVGGHGRAARRGQLGGRRPVGAPLRRRLPRAARGDPRRHGRGRRRLRRRGPPRGRGRLRPARAALPRTATCCRRSSPRRQPAHRRVRRLAGEPAALPARGVRRRARRRGRPTAGDRAHLGDRLGAGRQHRARTRSRSPGRSSRTAPTPSTSRPGRSPRTSSPRSAAPTRRRSPTGSATRSPPGRASR